MLGRSLLERDKDELVLGVNSFDKPKIISDYKAWSQLLLSLIFLNPGTYPSLPTMGIGIENYEYDFTDAVVDSLAGEIRRQQEAFLPDIPLTAVQVSTMPYNETNVLLIQLGFTTQMANYASVIAISTTPEKIIDIEVSW